MLRDSGAYMTSVQRKEAIVCVTNAIPGINRKGNVIKQKLMRIGMIRL